jgi:hypothetical protein
MFNVLFPLQAAREGQLPTSLRLPSGHRRIFRFKRILPSGQRRKPSGEIGDCELFANEPSLAAKRVVKHSGEAIEVLLPARDGRNNVPAVYSLSYFARDVGLLSYGVDPVDLPHHAATYADRILRGAKPGDLPVQFPTKFEMLVNLKTAKALGLTVPRPILLRADEVIE